MVLAVGIAVADKPNGNAVAAPALKLLLAALGLQRLSYAEWCANLSGYVQKLKAHIYKGLAIEQLAQRAAPFQLLGANCCGGSGRRGRGSAAFSKAEHQRQQQQIEAGAGASEQLFRPSLADLVVVLFVAVVVVEIVGCCSCW